MAVGDRLDQAETVLGDGLCQELVQFEGVIDRGAGDVAGAGGDGQFADREGRLNIPVGGGGGASAEGCGRAVLAAGHAVNGIVDHQGSDADVAPGGVDEVVPADRQGVAVAHDGDHFHVGSGDLQTGGKGQGAAVGGVQGVEVHVDGHARRAADAGHQGHIVVLQTEVVDGADQCAHHHADAAAGAPDGGELLVLAQLLQGLAALEPVRLRDEGFIVFQGGGIQDVLIRSSSIPPSHPAPSAE